MTRFQVRNKLRKAGTKAKSIAVGTLSMGLGNVPQGKSRLGLRKASLGVATVAFLSVAATQTPAHAYQIYFGEDLGLGEGTRLPSTPNSDTARNNFLSKLVGVGTETFESFAPGSSSPLSINFPGAGNATLQGGGSIANVPTGTNGFGRYPISGNKFFETDSGNFSINFSNPVAAFGFYGVDIGDFNGQITLTLKNGINSILTVPNTVSGRGGSALYYGLIAENANETFTQVSFGNTAPGTDVFAFDDFTIGSLNQVKPPSEPVPEPLTILGSLTAGGIGVALRRKRQQQEKETAKV